MWINDVDSDSPQTFRQEWRTKFHKLSEKIRDDNEVDLLKIIFEDTNVQKEGNRCSIENWKKFVEEQHQEMIAVEKKRNDPLTTDFGSLIWYTGRFKMDVFAILRMFRSHDEGRRGRFENIIYHAGAWHTANMTRMLKSLNATTNESLSPYRAIIDRQNKSGLECMNIDMIQMLNNMSHDSF